MSIRYHPIAFAPGPFEATLAAGGGYFAALEAADLAEPHFDGTADTDFTAVRVNDRGTIGAWSTSFGGASRRTTRLR